jgi:conserved oligomeric Golgi complex subunit 5
MSTSVSNPGRTTMPNVGNTPQFRALLWTNIEKILDLIYTYVAQLSNLARVLAKKKDPITHTSFIDELMKVNHRFLRVYPSRISSHFSMDIQGN